MHRRAGRHHHARLPSQYWIYSSGKPEPLHDAAIKARCDAVLRAGALNRGKHDDNERSAMRDDHRPTDGDLKKHGSDAHRDGYIAGIAVVARRSNHLQADRRSQSAGDVS